MKGKEKTPATKEEKDCTEKVHESIEGMERERDEKQADEKHEVISERETSADQPTQEQSKELGKLNSGLFVIGVISTST